MKLSALAILCLLAAAQASLLNEKIKRSAREKFYFKERPFKVDKALFEKSPESSEEAEVSSQEEGSESEEEESSRWTFDLNDLFSRTKEKLPDLDEVQETFSKVWGQFFGKESGETSAEAPNTNSFISQVLSFAQPWWQGENVCSREETFEEEDSKEEGDEGILGVFSSLSTTCRDVGSAYKCTMKVGKEGKRKVRTLIYECCHGFARQRGQKGCTQTLELKYLSETLQGMNLTQFLDTATIMGLNAKWSGENTTLFVPSNDALTTVTDSDEINFVVSETADKLQFVREIMMGHMVKGWEYSHNWEDEMVLNSEADGAIIRINFYPQPRPFATANCARIASMDRKTTGGLIHTVEKVLMPARQTIWEMLGMDTRFSTFVSLIPPALQEKLMDKTNHYTLLAFTDDDFNKLSSDMKERIRSKEGCMQHLLNEMVIPHTICSAAVHGQVHVRTLSGRLLNGTKGEEKVFFGGVGVAKADRVATNGVIHVMEGVILPDYVLDVVRVAEKQGGEVFAELLKTTDGLGATVKGMEAATIFVPPNEALLELPDDIQSDETKRAELLKNHIVNNKVEVGLKNAETLLETEAGRSISMTAKPLGLSFRPFAQRLLSAHVGCARVIKANVKGCGGLVHFIDRPLTIPSKSLLEVLASRPELSEFNTMLEMSEISKELGGEFRGTILAPTNDAIAAALDEEQKEEVLADKPRFQAFIKRHILTEEACCHSMGSGNFFQPKRHSTLEGRHLHSHIRGGHKAVGGSMVKECDMAASNGLIHSIAAPIPANRRSSFFNRRRTNSRRPSIFDWPF